MHRKAEGSGFGSVRDLDRMQMLEQGWAAVPRHTPRTLGDVVAVPRRQRDGADGDLAQACRHRGKCRRDLGEGGLGKADEVHLVDRKHQPVNAEQRANKSVPLGLRENALARVDQDHRELAVRRAGRHVARVLLVAGRIGDDKRAQRRGEKPVGHIDRDPLLALVLEPVEQQRKIEITTGGAKAARLALEGRELIVEDQRAFVQQAADQRRLAVIDRTASQKAQQLLFRRPRRPVGSGGHQK